MQGILRQKGMKWRDITKTDIHETNEKVRERGTDKRLKVNNTTEKVLKKQEKFGKENQ